MRSLTPLKLVLLLASTLAVMSGPTVAPALPAIQAAFGDTPHADTLARLVLTMPALLIVIAAPFAGLAADRFAHRPILLGSLALYGVAGASGLVLDALVPILVGRAVLGVAVAGIMTSVTTLIADCFGGQDRARMLGLQGAFMSGAGVLYVTLAGLLAEVSWRAPFLIYLAAFGLLPLAALAVPEPRREQAPRAGGGGGGGGGEASATLLAAICGTALACQMAYYMVPTLLPHHLERLTGAGGAQSGAAIASAILFAAIASLLYWRVKDRLDHVRITALASMVMGAGHAVVGLASGYVVVLAGLAAIGLALGLLMPNLNAWATAAAPGAGRGRAVAALTGAAFLGQFLSPVATKPLVDAVAYGPAYATAGVLLLGTAVVLLLARARLLRLASGVAA